MTGFKVLNLPYLRARFVLALAALFAGTALPQARAGAALDPILGRIASGENDAALARAPGPGALRDQTLGGFKFAVYFRMDKTRAAGCG